MILKCHDQLDRVPTVMKTKYNNYVIDRIDGVYVENKTELPWLIKLGVVYGGN